MKTATNITDDTSGFLKTLNLVPVIREVLADLDTPVSAYLKLADGPYSYLFESVVGGEKWGRYSVIGLPARNVIKVTGSQITVSKDGQPVERYNVDDPLAWIETFSERYKVKVNADLPRFTGGLVGYFGYDTIRYIESRLAKANKPDPLNIPDILLMVSDEVVVFDNLSGKIYVIVHVAETERKEGENRLNAIIDRLKQPLAKRNQTRVVQVNEKDFVPNFTQHDFEDAVSKIKDYILSGDAMQVVLSQRMSVPFNARPMDLYRALRCINPSPYMFHLNLNNFQIVGSSPEILARLEGGEITVRPIAGTRPRGATPEEDILLEKELLADPKERAEHLMLIDLGRNDVGRIAKVGSVRVTENMGTERYSHVMHIVSNVNGQLKNGMCAMDVHRAAFPAGTVSGAPKIRAMEIIDELEPIKRGVYAGAIGYIGWSGNMDTAIAIRTAVIKDGTLYFQAGAGIVADSIPRNEWEETLNKGRAIFTAVEMAEAGLDSLYA